MALQLHHRTALAITEARKEAVYLHELQDGFQAKCVIKTWLEFHNAKRPYTALDIRPPDDAYFETRQMNQAARTLTPIHLSQAANLSRKAEQLQIDLSNRIAFEPDCEFSPGHVVFLASKVTKQGVYKFRRYLADIIINYLAEQCH